MNFDGTREAPDMAAGEALLALRNYTNDGGCWCDCFDRGYMGREDMHSPACRDARAWLRDRCAEAYAGPRRPRSGKDAVLWGLENGTPRFDHGVGAALAAVRGAR